MGVHKWSQTQTAKYKLMLDTPSSFLTKYLHILTFISCTKIRSVGPFLTYFYLTYFSQLLVMFRSLDFIRKHKNFKCFILKVFCTVLKILNWNRGQFFLNQECIIIKLFKPKFLFSNISKYLLVK